MGVRERKVMREPSRREGSTLDVSGTAQICAKRIIEHKVGDVKGWRGTKKDVDRGFN